MCLCFPALIRLARFAPLAFEAGADPNAQRLASALREGSSRFVTDPRQARLLPVSYVVGDYDLRGQINYELCVCAIGATVHRVTT